VNETTIKTEVPEYVTSSTAEGVTFVFQSQENDNLGYVIRLPSSLDGNTRKI
jgi:hypothetical protein